MAQDLLVDPVALREQVRAKYREVAVDPSASFHFHTGRSLAGRLGYEAAAAAALPDRAVESFAGQVGPGGQVVGVDMTPEMLAKSRQTADALGLAHVQFREGLAESLPVPCSWADVVISNGVINLCADKQAVFAEIFRVLRPGGRLQFADIANSRPVPAGALRDIDLWTG
jgi:arsenite methyltransferase